IIIEIIESINSEESNSSSVSLERLINEFKNVHKEFEGLNIHWTSSNEVAIGPVKTDLEPVSNEFKYYASDVIISLSGFSNDSTHIIFAKEDHKSIYGVPNCNRGVFAKIIGGKKTLEKLTEDDKVLSVSGIVERDTITHSTAISDLNTQLEEGNQIFTYVLLEPSKEAPKSSEHLFSLIDKEKVMVDYESNSFLGLYKLQGINKDSEHIGSRKRGTVTLRNNGKGVGNIYIYREDRVASISHNIIGSVKKGMELVDMGKNGDYITLKTNPERIMTLAMTQKAAGEFLASRGIKQVKEGLVDDDAFVVAQNPKYTLDIIENKEVITTGVSEDNLALINVSENAPRSAWYFRKITGLLENPVGALKVHFAYPGMNIIIFEGNDKEAKGLIPENTPKDLAKAGEIGLTNMSRKNTGLLGVRSEDSKEFGPTGEPFDGTNIVGKITKGIENLDSLKGEDVLYVCERMPESRTK
ncbi:MAG: methyl-coenzyme M reductase-associated protein Mmp3, partial [Methanobacteriaceae archaeon]